MKVIPLIFFIIFFASFISTQQTLYINSVQTGLLEKGADKQTWQLLLVVNGTGFTPATSVTVFPLEIPSLITGTYYPPSFAVTYSNVAGAYYGSPNAIRTVISPDQSFIIPQLTNQIGEEVPVFITVEALNISSPTNYTISSSLVTNPLESAHEISQGVYSYQGRVKSGQRLYFSYTTYRESQIVVELCATNDNRTNNNPIPGAFLWNVYNDQMPQYNQQLVDYPCGQGESGNIFIKDPNTSNDSRYFKICPSIVYFSEGQQPNSYFALDVLHFWQAPIVFGYYDFNFFIYTDQYVSLSWKPIPSSSGTTEESFVYSPLSISTVDFPNIHIKFFPAYVAPSQNYTAFQYGIFSDSHLDVTQRQLTAENDLFSSACFLVNNAASFLYQNKWYDYNELNRTSGLDVEITIPNWTYPTLDHSGTPFHINIVARSAVFGDLAYEYFTVTDTFAPNTPEIDQGLSGWEITFIVVAVIVAVAVIIALIVGTVVFVVRYRKSQYSQF